MVTAKVDQMPRPFLLPAKTEAASPLEWSNLEPLPDEHGFAGAFAGISNGALIVAGGANFPDGFPWEGGEKAWHDSIFVLEEPGGAWKKLDEKLPRPLAYGVSASTSSGTYFIGGQDGSLRVHMLEDEAVHAKGRIVIPAGQSVSLIEAGGGGMGDPAERDRDAVQHDLDNGFISSEAAARDYDWRD